ncbi:hypothetical protein B0H16DRAFT_1511383 [Mycena metata]|uniref:Uncharacterized protein n=1 Tax=Mycena metata TaxID=1033252 RepID=A0AAD7JWI4_9AGAR|nr:hypothetical protein B0H16DRAFT_1511383 [Mycena metata]
MLAFLSAVLLAISLHAMVYRCRPLFFVSSVAAPRIDESAPRVATLLERTVKLQEAVAEFEKQLEVRRQQLNEHKKEVHDCRMEHLELRRSVWAVTAAMRSTTTGLLALEPQSPVSDGGPQVRQRVHLGSRKKLSKALSSLQLHESNGQ